MEEYKVIHKFDKHVVKSPFLKVIDFFIVISVIFLVGGYHYISQPNPDASPGIGIVFILFPTPLVVWITSRLLYKISSLRSVRSKSLSSFLKIVFYLFFVLSLLISLFFAFALIYSIFLG